MVTKQALAILRRMEIAVNANSDTVARSMEIALHEELGVAKGQVTRQGEVAGKR